MLKKRFAYFLLTIPILAISSSAWSQGEPVEDLRMDWLIYSVEEGTFLPYIDGLHTPNTVHFKLDLNRYQDYDLQLNMPDGISFLIENDIVFVTEGYNLQVYNIDSLKRKYEVDQILVSLFSESLKPEKLETKIVDMNPTKSWVATQSGYDIVQRKTEGNSDFFIISILIVLSVVVVVKRVLKSTFFEYFSLQRMLSIRPKSEALFSTGIFSTSNLLMIWLYATALGFTIVMTLQDLSNMLLEEFGIAGSFQLIITAIAFSLILIGLMVGRFFLVRILSGIYRLRKFQAIQFYDYFRITLFLSTIFFGMAVFNMVTDGVYLNEFQFSFFVVVMILLALRPLFIFLKLNKLSGYKNLHLFSYICGTEIIPLIIIVKIFLD